MGRKGLFSLVLATIVVAYCTAATAKSGDANVIDDFAKQLSNPPPSWVHGGDVCSGTFVGIACDSSGRVNRINLTDMGLSGTLTPLLPSLSALEVLDLGGNNLKGAIPSLTGMASLTQLVLTGNEFTTVTPNFLQGLTSLMILVMDNLPLEPWFIPEAIADCTALQIFSASNVSINGELPAALGNLKSLNILWLSYNYLRGSLPAWLAELNSLESLVLNNQMSDVKLSGKIDVLASIKSLRELWLQSNSFTGPIPEFNNSQLESLLVNDNMLTGLVPASLMGLESLGDVGLSNNFLQGPMPVFRNGVITDMVSGNRFCLPHPGPCDAQVSILLDIASGFGFPLELAQTWAGNTPCDGSWVGIVCKGIIVVEIILSGQNLSGIISPAFANLPMLERLDLSKNQLSGVIPEALATLKDLKFLNVSNNNLSGLIPRFMPFSVEVVAEGNHIGSRNSKAQMVLILVGSILVAGILVLFVWFCLCHLKKRRNSSGSALPTHLRTQVNIETTDSARHSVPAESIDTGSARHSVTAESIDTGSARHSVIAESIDNAVSYVKKIPLQTLLNATYNFSDNMILGKGGSAVVFKGLLNEELVAIKRYNNVTEEMKEFAFEIDVFGKIRHRNLVKLLGYCRNKTEKILVYEYMAAGTLRDHLQLSGHSPLTWAQRMTICLDVAYGIAYLHGMTEKAYMHRDIKTSNILLDQNLTAKVSDFGLVRIDGEKSKTEKCYGTFGYIAPEHALTGELSIKGDVYAYGVVLMEIITGRKVIDDSLPQDERLLVLIFRTNVHDKEKFRNIVDPTLEVNAADWNTLMELACLAHNCTASEPEQRPSMNKCVVTLSSMLDQWKPTLIVSDKGETSNIGLKELVENWKKDDITMGESD